MDKRLNDELAEYTDRLLAGEEDESAMDMSMENHDLGQVVRTLRDVINPAEQPDPAFRERLRARLQDEWNRTMRPQQIRQLERVRALRRVALAAALIFVVGGAVLLLNAVGGNPDNGLEGTATSLDLWLILAILGAGGAALAIWFILRQR